MYSTYFIIYLILKLSIGVCLYTLEEMLQQPKKNNYEFWRRKNTHVIIKKTVIELKLHHTF